MKHPSIDIIALTTAVIPSWDRKNEPGLTSLLVGDLLLEPDLHVWCSCSDHGKSRDHRATKRVSKSYTGVRSVDLAYGKCDEPSVLVQIKYDKGLQRTNGEGSRESCFNTPRNHALRDLLYLAVDLNRMGDGAECHMLSVVHEANLEMSHRWIPFLEEGDWKLRCEPSTVERFGRHTKDLVSSERRTVQPYNGGQVNEMFGTKWQRAGYGLFARPGVLEVRFRTRSRLVGEFAIIDWQVLGIDLMGAKMPLAEWLP